eukprot:580253-Rhodomonas_salina.1
MEPRLGFSRVPKKAEREHVWAEELPVSIHTDILQLYCYVVVSHGKSVAAAAIIVVELHCVAMVGAAADTVYSVCGGVARFTVCRLVYRGCTARFQQEALLLARLPCQWWLSNSDSLSGVIESKDAKTGRRLPVQCNQGIVERLGGGLSYRAMELHVACRGNVCWAFCVPIVHLFGPDRMLQWSLLFAEQA